MHPEETTAADDVERRSRRRDRRLLVVLVLVLLLVVGGLYAAGFALSDDRLPRGTTIAGVDVGGQRPSAAAAALRRALQEEAEAPVEVQVRGRTFPLDPEEAGLEVDWAGTVAQVPVGGSWNPADMWESFVGGEDYDLVVVAIDGLLSERIGEIAERVDEEPVEGDVVFRADGARPVYPEPGIGVRVEEAVAAVTEAYPTDEPITLPTGELTPTISEDDVGRAMREFANPAMSGSVVYSFGGEQVVLAPQRFARALSMKPVRGELEPRVNRKKLLAALKPAMRTVGERPRNATVRIVDGRPVVIPAKKGVTLDEDMVVDSFLELVVAEGSGRRLEVDTELTDPKVSTKEARGWRIRELVSDFTTYYPHADYRNVNIGRAAEIVDGTVLAPGQTFSLNGTVGERTRANGFTEGFIISDGILKEDLGGGVSQLATTLFNAMFFAGLEDVEHKPHSFYIDRYPVGREATVAWPVVDLRFTNDTDYGVLIQTIHQPSSPGGSGAITVRMWSTKVWDIESRTSNRYNYTAPDTRRLSGDDCVPNEGFSGFDVDVTRIFRRAGESRVVRREVFNTTYIPSDTVICS